MFCGEEVQRQVDPVDDSLTPSVEWTPGWPFCKTWLSVPPHWLSLASWTGWRTKGVKGRNYSFLSQERVYTEIPWEKVAELMKMLWGFDNHRVFTHGLSSLAPKENLKESKRREEMLKYIKFRSLEWVSLLRLKITYIYFKWWPVYLWGTGLYMSWFIPKLGLCQGRHYYMTVHSKC